LAHLFLAAELGGSVIVGVVAMARTASPEKKYPITRMKEDWICDNKDHAVVQIGSFFADCSQMGGVYQYRFYHAGVRGADIGSMAAARDVGGGPSDANGLAGDVRAPSPDVWRGAG